MPPATAMMMPKMSDSASVAPATARTRSMSPLPKAWPISTDAPVPRPMTKAMKKNITGKKTVAAASASTPIMWPRKMLLIVPDRDWSTFDSIIGARKTRKVRHRGIGGLAPRGGAAGDAARRFGGQGR